jgi:hypothetical protein
MFGSLFLKNWPCLPGPAGPPIVSRSASEPRERRHRSRQKRPPAPGGAQDRPAVGAPSFSGPAGAGPLVGRDRGRSQNLAAARLTVSAPSGSESAPLAMRNFGSFGSFGSFGLRAADFSTRAVEWKPERYLRKSEQSVDDYPLPPEREEKVTTENSEEPILFCTLL